LPARRQLDTYQQEPQLVSVQAMLPRVFAFAMPGMAVLPTLLLVLRVFLVNGRVFKLM